MDVEKNDTAVVFIDPQNEVLSEKGLAWPMVHESLKENNTIANMERIFQAAKAQGFEVFIRRITSIRSTKVGNSTARLRLRKPGQECSRARVC